MLHHDQLSLNASSFISSNLHFIMTLMGVVSSKVTPPTIVSEGSPMYSHCCSLIECFKQLAYLQQHIVNMLISPKGSHSEPVKTVQTFCSSLVYQGFVTGRGTLTRTPDRRALGVSENTHLKCYSTHAYLEHLGTYKPPTHTHRPHAHICSRFH